MITDLYLLKCFLFLATSPAAATLTCEAQEERSRLSGTAYGDIKVTIYIGLSIVDLHCMFKFNILVRIL